MLLRRLMKYFAQHILQVIFNLQYGCLSSVVSQSHEQVLTLVDDFHREQFHHLRTVLFSPEFLNFSRAAITCDAKVFAQMFVEILDEKTRAGLNIL